MRKRSLLIAVFAIVFVFIAGYGNAYDQVKPDASVISTDFENEFSYVRVRAIGTAIGLSWDYEKRMYILKEGFYDQRGSGVVIAAGYVLTAAHIVTPEIIQIPEGRCITRITDVVGRTSRTVLIFDYKDNPIVATVLYENIDIDLAILKYNHKKNSWLKPLPYSIEYMAEPIKAGDVVCAVVHDREEDGSIGSNVLLRWGTVVNPEPYGPNNKIIAFLNSWDITLNLAIQGGDSGSPLFVFRNGKPIFIGIVRAMYWGQWEVYTYAVQLPVIWKILIGRR